MRKVQLNEIIIKSLPAELIIDGFIIGYQPEVSYEDYLTDYVNESSLLLAFSKNESYTHTPKGQQSDGECDCCSSQYELDFKLLGTQSGIYAKSNLSLQKAYIAEGVCATLIPRQYEGMNITLTGNLMRRYSLEELFDIDNGKAPKFDRNQLCPELDVKSILKVVKCKKNTLFYFTDFMYSECDFIAYDIAKTAQSLINEYFGNIFKFRDYFVPDKDTFLAVVIQGYMCIALWQDESIQFKDYIPLSKSSVFSDLYGTLSTAYTKKLIMR